MSQNCQSGILFENSKFAIFMEADLNNNHFSEIAEACKTAYAIWKDIYDKFTESSIGLTLGFGANLWQHFSNKNNGIPEGADLRNFTPYGKGLAPAMQCDLMIHIQSSQNDVNIHLAQKIYALFSPYITVKNETHAYRLLENRGYDGFVDGTENPKDDAAVKTAIIDKEHCDKGGSYVLLQKYVHNLTKWNRLSVSSQEKAVGRTKETDEELEGEDRLITSHLGRVDLKENGQSLKILRQSMPFGTISGEHGLMFCAYSANFNNLDKQLKSMFGDLDGKVDLMVYAFSKPVTGAFYFAPSVDKLLNLI